MTLDEAVKQLCEAPSCLSKSKARRILEEYGREILNTPMGVSNWMNHGIKYGYLEYFNLKKDNLK